MHIQNGPFVINSNLIQKLLLASFFRISRLKITLYSLFRGRWPAMSRKAEKNMWLHHKLTFLLLVWYIPNLLWDAKFEAPGFKAQLTLLLLDVRRQISMRLDSSVSRVSSTRVPNRISLHQWFNPASSTLWSSIIHERSEGSHEEFNELIGKLYFLVDVVLILISCGSLKPQIEMCLDKMVKVEHNWTSVS